MTREQVLELFYQAHRETDSEFCGENPIPLREPIRHMIERFAALVAAAEREECAKVCDGKVAAEYATGKVDHNEIGWTQACAAAIRARGEA